MEAITRDSLEALTPMERRQFIGLMLQSLMIAGKLEGLVTFLQNDGILSARLRDKGPDFVLQDFLRAYPLYCDTDHALAKQLLKCFLGFLFDYKEEVNLNNVFVWLQNVNDNRLLVDAVGLVASAQWLPVGADPSKWKRFELLCRRSQASNWRRRDRRYSDAWDALTTLVNEWESIDPAERQELSVIEYERGYILFLQGRPKEATDLLFYAAALAQEVGDHVGAIINRFFGYNFRRYDCQLPQLEVKTRMISLRAELERCQRGPRVDNMLLNMAMHIFQVCCVLGDHAEAQFYANLALRGEMMRRMKDDAVYRLIEHRITGQLALVQNRWPEALRAFTAFLDVDLVGWGTQVKDLVALESSIEEAAQGYRDAGIALQALKEIGLARKVWQRGLHCPDEALNLYCKRDIRQLLKETESAQSADKM